MNNLLRTLTESNVKSAFPDTDFRLLLTTVKEGRKQSYDHKLSDAFYDALEGLLLDLKTITIDNRDAEAFLKPVSKAEVADYYDVISNPMDFQTMLRKVKQKLYKSKREFKDDLELIWSNCNTYNAAENHPLRQCVKRLKAKADTLLKHITDRKDRADPPIPAELAASPCSRPNGQLNGYTLSSHHRSPSYPNSSTGSSTLSTARAYYPPSSSARRGRLRDVPFAETPAILRTPEGMVNFRQLDQDLAKALDTSNQATTSSGGTAKSKGKVEKPLTEERKAELVDRLNELAPPYDYDEGDESSSLLDGSASSSLAVDGPVGEKRKLNGMHDHRPRKRSRCSPGYPLPLPSERDQLSELWWGAVQSDFMLGNGLPDIPFASSSSVARYASMQASSSSSSSIPTSVAPTTHPPFDSPKRKRKRNKTVVEPKPQGLLTLMNNNLKAMKRVRHTHAKFAALVSSTINTEDPDADGMGTVLPQPPPQSLVPSLPPLPHQHQASRLAGGIEEDGLGAVDDKVDERPWTVRGKGGIEMGEKSADDCLRWMGTKVLEHVGFQGTSKAALDVMAGVTAEYLANFGRTIRYLCDKFGHSMTAEEIILHTLFESGTSRVQDLERYVVDDVQRYGSRLGDLEKKLVAAYRDSTSGEVMEDEGLFEESDEETGVLAMGDFADTLGEDYLGLRELGIAAEFGMTSLAIPKKLLRGRKGQNKPAAAKPKEPPPPYPPPPPFIPLSSDKTEDQIGLLRPYYHSRFASLAATQAPPPLPPPPLLPPALPNPIPTLPPPLTGPVIPGLPPLPGPTIGSALQPSLGQPDAAGSDSAVPNVTVTDMDISEPSTSLQAPSSTPSQPQLPPPVLALADDAPNPTQAKMGPLGQITKSGSSGTSTKKKSKGTGAAATTAGSSSIRGTSAIPPSIPSAGDASIIVGGGSGMFEGADVMVNGDVGGGAGGEGMTPGPVDIPMMVVHPIAAPVTTIQPVAGDGMMGFPPGAGVPGSVGPAGGDGTGKKKKGGVQGMGPGPGRKKKLDPNAAAGAAPAGGGAGGTASVGQSRAGSRQPPGPGSGPGTGAGGNNGQGQGGGGGQSLPPFVVASA